jgi:hypothetical protein
MGHHESGHFPSHTGQRGYPDLNYSAGIQCRSASPACCEHGRNVPRLARLPTALIGRQQQYPISLPICTLHRLVIVKVNPKAWWRQPGMAVDAVTRGLPPGVLHLRFGPDMIMQSIFLTAEACHQALPWPIALVGNTFAAGRQGSAVLCSQCWTHSTP